MDFSKQTKDQIKKTLKEQGVVFRSKAKKGDLVTMLVEEDAKKKQDAAGGGSKVAKVNPNESSGSRLQASSAPPKEVWIIETESRSQSIEYEPDTNIVGVFTSKEEAIKNAKIAFTNMDLFEDFVGDWDNEDLEDHSEKVNKECEGGVLFSIGLEGMVVGLQGRRNVDLHSIGVNMYKSYIDKLIKPGRAAEPWSMNDKWSDFKPIQPNFRAKFPRTMDYGDADCSEEESDSD